ncbi:hypothetical protein CEXT_366831 [Caerostris extrusa]|uniref:Uncharacterized protein n=1 Tax=Caerostris extrusa TaxID=172846 RepID=A0AAV4W982_CAEEX|nr:hypothetical protein CEXT_366831 [Caerostris extrusa]
MCFHCIKRYFLIELTLLKITFEKLQHPIFPKSNGKLFTISNFNDLCSCLVQNMPFSSLVHDQFSPMSMSMFSLVHDQLSPISMSSSVLYPCPVQSYIHVQFSP